MSAKLATLRLSRQAGARFAASRSGAAGGQSPPNFKKRQPSHGTRTASHPVYLETLLYDAL